LLWGGGCLALCLCIWVLAIGAVMLASDEQIEQVKRWLGLSVSSQAAEWAPADALTFIVVNPHFAELASFVLLKPIFEKNPAYLKAVLDLAQSYTPGRGVNFERDVLPWLGAEMAFVVLGFEVDPQSTWRTNPNFVWMADTRNVSQSEVALARIRQDAADVGWTFSSERYKDIELISSKPPLAEAWRRGGTLAIFQNRVMYGANAATLKKIIDAKSGDPQRTLQHHPKYRAVLNKLPQGHAAMLYMDLGEVIKQSSPETSRSTAALNDLQSLGVSLSFAPDGLRFDYITLFDEQRSSSALKKLLATYKPNPNTVFNQLPPSTILAIGGQDLKAQWEYHVAVLSDKEKENFQQSRDKEKREKGIDIEADLMAWLTGEYAFAFVHISDPSKDFSIIPPVLLLIEVRDQALAQSKIDKLARAYMSPEEFIVSQTIRGIPMQIVSRRVVSRNPSTVYGYGFVGNYLVIGTSEEVLGMAVDSLNQPLSRDDAFQKVIKPLPRANIGMSYLSIPWLMEFAKPTESSRRAEFECEAVPFFKPVKGIGLSYGVPRNDAQMATLFIHISEPPTPQPTPCPTKTPTFTPTPPRPFVATGTPTPTPRPTLTPTPTRRP
jgi:hypothetical protein